MKRVVITGATSMIGVALVEECVKNGVEVLAVVRKKSPRIGRLPESDLIRICECELDDLASIPKSPEPYDVLYHMAWSFTSKSHRDDPILQEQNIRYTLNAVELAERLGCKKFVGAGSQAEYGRVDELISPDTPARPTTAYGMAKHAAGLLSRKLCEKCGITHIWARIFSVYGRRDNDGTMLNYAVDGLLSGETVRFSAATQMWDYLHESDAGKIFYLIGERVTSDKVYCVASGDCRPLKEFIMELISVFGPDARFEFAEGTNDAVSLQTDIEPLVNDIDYTPQVSFKQGIEDVIRYRRKKIGR